MFVAATNAERKLQLNVVTRAIVVPSGLLTRANTRHIILLQNDYSIALIPSTYFIPFLLLIDT